MEFTLKIMIDATPAVVSIFSKLLGIDLSTESAAPAPAKQEQPKKAAPAAENKLKSVKKEPVKAEPAEPEEVEGEDAPENLLGGEEEEENEGTVTIERIREVATPIVKNGKLRPQLQKLLQEFKAIGPDGKPALTSLPAKQYTAFYERLKEIKAA